jgi:hypothetical protein
MSIVQLLIKDLETFDKKNIDILRKFYNLPKNMKRKELLYNIAKLNMEIKIGNLPFADCTNEVNIFTQDEWTEEEQPNLKVKFLWYADFSKKPTIQCYNKDNLLEWLNDTNHTLYKWIPNILGTEMEPMGYRGGPSNSFTVQNWPDSQFVVKTNLPNSDTLTAFPIAKNMRIGKQFGISQNHGQLPGFVVYELSTETDPKKFYIDKICKENEACRRNYANHTLEQLFLIVDELSEKDSQSCYDQNGNRINPQQLQQLQQLQQFQEAQQAQQAQPFNPRPRRPTTLENIATDQLIINNNIPDDLNIENVFDTTANDKYLIISYENYVNVDSYLTQYDFYINIESSGKIFVEIEPDNSDILLINTAEGLYVVNLAMRTSTIYLHFDEENIESIKSITVNNETSIYLMFEDFIRFVKISDNQIVQTYKFDIYKPIAVIPRSDGITDIIDLANIPVVPFNVNRFENGENTFEYSTRPGVGVYPAGKYIGNYTGLESFETVLYVPNYIINIDRIYNENAFNNTFINKIIIGSQRINGELLTWSKNTIYYKNYSENIDQEIIKAAGFIINDILKIFYITNEYKLYEIATNVF